MLTSSLGTRLEKELYEKQIKKQNRKKLLMLKFEVLESYSPSHIHLNCPLVFGTSLLALYVNEMHTHTFSVVFISILPCISQLNFTFGMG